MPANTWQDLGIEIPYGASGQIRVTCPQCTPHRKPGNQRRRDLAVNIDEGQTPWNHGKIEGTKYEMPPAMLETSRGPTRKELSPVRDQCIPITTEDTTESLPCTRSEALAIGAKRYFTGRPCKRGHIAPRYVANFHCAECLRMGSREFYEANRERENERSREYAKRDPEGNRRRSTDYRKQVRQ